MECELVLGRLAAGEALVASETAHVQGCARCRDAWTLAQRLGASGDRSASGAIAGAPGAARLEGAAPFSGGPLPVVELSALRRRERGLRIRQVGLVGAALAAAVVLAIRMGGGADFGGPTAAPLLAAEERPDGAGGSGAPRLAPDRGEGVGSTSFGADPFDEPFSGDVLAGLRSGGDSPGDLLAGDVFARAPARTHTNHATTASAVAPAPTPAAVGVADRRTDRRTERRPHRAADPLRESPFEAPLAPSTDLSSPTDLLEAALLGERSL